MKKYLAIGISYEEGVSWSISVDTNDMKDIVKQLTAYSDCPPDEVLLIENGETGPGVVKQFSE
jgi:hypothetical protein